MKIYLTSRLSNTRYNDILEALQAAGHDVFDYRSCDALVLVIPGGRGAHLEAGYVAGRGKPVFFLREPGLPPKELMYMMGKVVTLPQLLESLS
jgi:nucleoside 2-deoxyribosyltransferase